MLGWSDIPHGTVGAQEYPAATFEQDLLAHITASREFLDEPETLDSAHVAVISTMARQLGTLPRFGGSRAAFRVSSKEIVKVAFSEKGLQQNLLEAAISRGDWKGAAVHWTDLRPGRWDDIMNLMATHDFDLPVARTVVSSRFADLQLTAGQVISQEALTPVPFIMEADMPSGQKFFYSEMSRLCDVIQVGVRESTGEVAVFDF